MTQPSRPLAPRILDAHAHAVPDWLAADPRSQFPSDRTLRDLFDNPRARMATPGQMVEAMAESGVAASVSAGFGWNDLGLARAFNDALLEAQRRYAGRLFVFCGVNPLWGEAAVREVERCAALGARGVGELHPDTQGFRLDDTQVLVPVMEAARAHGMPVLTHASEPVGHPYAGKGHTTPEVLLRFIQAFPDNAIIAGHWGGGLPFYALMPEVAAALGNVYFDSAATPLLYSTGVWRTVTRLVGAEHVLFATDYPLLSHRRALAEVAKADLTAEERALVMGGNLIRILGVAG